MQSASSVTPAASVLLSRGPDSQEVFVVRRAANLRFFGGFLAFPGGKVQPADADRHTLPVLAVEQLPVGLQDRLAAAVRELFEETGILLARRPDGAFPDSGPELDALRRQVSEDDRRFAPALAERRLAIRGEDFVHLGNIVTPPFTPIRFDTAFFLATAPPGQEPCIWPGELDQGCWTTSDAILTDWERGECLVSPPTVMLLQAVRGRPIAEAPARLKPLMDALSAGAIHPIFFTPDVQLIPLRTVSLPPASYTNAYLVGRDQAFLIDPGTPFPEEQERLFAVLDRHLAQGKPLKAIVATHRHPDHVGAVRACSERYGVPVWAHPWTARALAGQIGVPQVLEEGDRLELGTAADGQPDWHLRVLHTPGHDPGHLAFYDPHYRLLLAGDMVSTVSSVVIAPPDGDLSLYLASLRRLRGLDCRLLFPSHGSVSNRPAETMDAALAHRAQREQQLLDALSSQPRTIPELARALYPDLPESLFKLAALQVQAGLIKLQREGRAEPAGEGDASWRRLIH